LSTSSSPSGCSPIRFEWPELTLEDEVLGALGELVEDLTELGTARSPVLVSVDTGGPPADPQTVWAPTRADGEAVAQVRVASARTPADMNAWHARRSAPLRRDGIAPAAAYVPPVPLGDEVAYIHGLDAAALPIKPLDPEWWRDMLVVAVDRDHSQNLPKAPSAFAFARATRKACWTPTARRGRPSRRPRSCADALASRTPRSLR